ncbi:putative oxidoreductase [Colletotrichum spinosum]|uniref:Putative oxidoreductase n=1 Tax=Colletotrichum spinosum TaxID=1347390 RepID=A0A4R8Q9X0_9PEZI|nr:putative oxidoreductase [Colletotrichum spinosum]
MSSIVITGVSKGIGYEFLRQYSENPSNTVIGLVRNKAGTDEKVSEDPDLKTRSNIHILEADVTDYETLKTAAAETAKITNGTLDYLIGNAGLVSTFDAYYPLGDLGSQPEGLTKAARDLFDINVIGNIHLVNLFLPLLLKGQTKKVTIISSGLGDAEVTRQLDVDVQPLYSASKAAVNMIVAKFSAQYKEQGVLFLALSPGLVEVGHFSDATEKEKESLGRLAAKFLQYAPHFRGRITPEQSVTAMRSVIDDASIEKGNVVQSASKSLTILGHAPVALGNVLVRLALASTTSSATAVLKALLAFSALHRYGVVTQAVELKISAIKALSSASATHGGTIEAMQHAAAGMLLSSFEIHQASCTSGEWTWYLDGVRYVIQAAGLDKQPYDRDLAVLLDWVYYNDVLARFSLRHYHPENLDKSARVLACDLPTSALHTTVFDVRITPSTAPSPMMPLVGLLSEVCDALSAPIKALATSEHADDHRNFVKVLEWKIRSTKVSEFFQGSADSLLFAELFQLALLVYLNRASENLLKQGPKVKKYIDGAFSIIAKMDVCHRMFPLFVFGCEARSDEQRAAILDIASRSEKDVAARSFNHFRLLLQAIWAQDDLCEGELNYWDKLTRVISRCTIPPTFV